MKKVKLYIAISLDGYVADVNGGVSWLGGDGSDETNLGSYMKFMDTIDTVILGYTTYNQIVDELSPNEWVYAGKQTYVLTHRKIENKEDIIFTDENIEELISKLKLEEGKDIWICGGANIVQQLHKRDLIEEYSISIIPTILGNGIKLFAEMEKETKLCLKSTENYNGIVDLVYEKRDI